MHYQPIAAVLRAGRFSPNHICQDAAILNSVVDQLRKRGCVVNLYSEDRFCSEPISEPVIINMCREADSVTKLQALEDEGRLVLNSGYGIENCIRQRMTRIILGNAIPYPESVIVRTDEKISGHLTERGFTNCWVKKGDNHSMHKEDVSYVRHPAEAQEILQEYFLRGIESAVISKHMTGELVKFYGIAQTDFFFWFHPFGNDLVPDANTVVSKAALNFDVNTLRSTLDRMCDLLDVKIYGGDCIVDAEGHFTIIDFHDWPSFAPCRNQAAVHIAKYVLQQMKTRGFATK